MLTISSVQILANSLVEIISKSTKKKRNKRIKVKKSRGKRDKLRLTNKAPDFIPEGSRRAWYLFWELYGKGNWKRKKLLKEAYPKKSDKELKEIIEKKSSIKPLQKIQDSKERLKVALAIWKYFANKRGLIPFIKGHKANSEAKAMLGTAFDRKRIKALQIVNKLLKQLVLQGKIKRSGISKETIYDVYSKTKDTFIISTEIRVNLPKGNIIDKGFNKILQSLHFEKAFKETSTYNKDNLLIEVQKKKNKFNIIISIVLMKAEALYFINKRTDDTLTIVRELSKKIKKIIKKKAFSKRMITAGVVLSAERKIVFDEKELTDEEKALLDNTIKEIQNTNSGELINTYNLDFIRSIGTPLYQYALTKALISECVRRELEIPSIWSEIVTNPEELLDPSVYKEKEKEEELKKAKEEE